MRHGQRLLLFLPLFLILLPLHTLSGADKFENARGSRISWARLKFPTTGYRRGDSLGWFYHPSGDVIIVDWLRKNTSMNMKLEWNIADIDRLDQMTDFPLLFSAARGRLQRRRARSRT